MFTGKKPDGNSDSIVFSAISVNVLIIVISLFNFQQIVNASCIFSDGQKGQCVKYAECRSAIILSQKGVNPGYCSLEEDTVCCVDHKNIRTSGRPGAQSGRNRSPQSSSSISNVKDAFENDPNFQRKKHGVGISNNGNNGRRNTNAEIIEEPYDRRPYRPNEDGYFLPPGLAKKKTWREEKTTENGFYYEHVTKKPGRGPNRKGSNKHTGNGYEKWGDTGNTRRPDGDKRTTGAWFNGQNEYENNYFNQRTTTRQPNRGYTTTKRPDYFANGEEYYNGKPTRWPQTGPSDSNRPGSQEAQGTKRPSYQGGSDFEVSRPNYHQGSNSGDDRPNYQQGNNFEGGRPSYQQGSNSGGDRPNYQQGNNLEGGRPSYQQGSNSGGDRPNYQQGNNFEGGRPNYQQGSNSGGDRPNYQQGNNLEGGRPNYQQGSNSGGDRPNYQQGNNLEGGRPNYEQGSNIGGNRPTSRPRPSRRRRISEQKCDEYSKQITENITGLPLTTNPDPVIIPVRKCITPQQLIVGGENTTLGEFPHMAAIGFRDRNKKQIAWNCGGTLISEQYVMTAAHCTSTSSGRPVKVRLGEYNLKKNDDGAYPVDYAIVDIIIHPDYKPPSKYNDIALLKLSRKVTFFKHIRPACLYSEETFSSSKAIATGWGRIYYDGGTSDILQKVVLNIVDNYTCNRLYKVNVKTELLSRGIVDSQLCAGELTGGKDTCQGDSGGPLSITNTKCIHHVIGITSFGKSCALPNSTGVYTRVSAYIPWIESVVWPK